jgi:hypothetical protein
MLATFYLAAFKAGSALSKSALTTVCFSWIWTLLAYNTTLSLALSYCFSLAFVFSWTIKVIF